MNEIEELSSTANDIHLSRGKKIILIAVIIVLALLSAVPLATWASDPATHSSTMQALEQKSQMVLELTASSAAISAGITAIPGDFGITIANKLVDISSSFAIVLAALYLEKYLLTILCLVAFRIVMPIAALAAIFLVAFWENEHIRSILTKTALKLVLVAFAMALAIPTSIYVSNLIEETYNASTQTVSSETTSSGDEIQDSAFDDATDSSQQDGSTQTTESDEEQSGVISSLSKLRNDILNGVSQFVSDAADTVSSGAQEVINDAKGYLNKVIEQFVIMIIVNCVIPILVIFFYIWLINLILGTSFKLNKNPLDKATGGIKNAIRERKTSAE